MDKNQTNYRSGSLPERFPLATALTPMQESALPYYEGSRALARGTLFPGLDLPFMGIVNPDRPSTPATELMTIDFVAHELGLYLDTHADDKDAFDLLQTMLALCKEARRRYRDIYGPVAFSDMLSEESYTWMNDPWPWDYKGKEG